MTKASFQTSDKLQSSQLTDERGVITNNKNTNPYCTFVSPIYTFCLAGNIFVYTPSKSTNREKYFKYFYYKRNMERLAGN